MTSFPDTVIDYLIPEKYKGKIIPSTEIQVPQNAYGVLVDSELDDSCSVIVFYNTKEVISTVPDNSPEHEVRKLLAQYFVQEN